MLYREFDKGGASPDTQCMRFYGNKVELECKPLVEMQQGIANFRVGAAHTASGFESLRDIRCDEMA